MKVKDGRLDLIDRLIANTRLSYKTGDPDTMIFAAEVLRELQKRKDELERMLQPTLPHLQHQAA